jgi:hypothetical protein
MAGPTNQQFIGPQPDPFDPALRRRPKAAAVIHKTTHSGSSVSSVDATEAASRGAALKAASEGEDRPSGTAEAGGTKIRSIFERSLAEQQAEILADPDAKYILAITKKIEGQNKIDLAEQIGQSLRFNRVAGPRPGNLRPRRSGTIFESQYDTLYTVPKEETQALLRIVELARPGRATNSTTPSRPFRTLTETSEFLLQSGQETDAEKFQLVETFDLPRIYFSGRRARVWTYSGILMNTENFQWKNRFVEMYEKHLRGTRCVENRTRVYLVYDDVIREGYLLAATVAPSVESLNTVQFSFTMFVTKARAMVSSSALLAPEERRELDQTQQQKDSELPSVRDALTTVQELRKIRGSATDDGQVFGIDDVGAIKNHSTAVVLRT